MTSTTEPSAGASRFAQLRQDLRRWWRNFRRWRRARPFWGGLFLMLSGVELLYSSNLDIGGLQIHFGREGFLSYLLPALMLLTGLFVWLTPKQRVFYSLLGTLTAVYSLIGLNLGGFFIGMLLGILGGALSFAWTPVKPVAPPMGYEPAEDDSAYAGATGYPGQADTTGDTGYAAVADDEVLPWDQPADAEATDEGQRRRGPGLYVSILVPLLLIATVAAIVLQHPGLALAEPCPNPTATGPPEPAPTTPDATTPAPEPTTPEPTTPEATTPAPAESSPAGFLAVAPALAVAPPLAAEPGPTPPPCAAPTTPAATGAAPTTAAPRLIAVAPGQPIVSAHPATMTADVLALSGFAYDGVVDLPTGDGTIRALRFSMTQVVATNFQLSITAGGLTQTLSSDPLTVTGDVAFYTSRFTGTFAGASLTFTPESPPPFTLPEMTFTGVTLALVFVDSDALSAQAFGQGWAT